MKIFFILAIIFLVVAGGLFLVMHTTTIDSLRQAVSPSSSAEEQVKKNIFSDSKELPPCPSDSATGCRKTRKNEQENAGCVGTGPVVLSSPMKYDDIGIIIPMGSTIGGHVTPIDHMYFQPIVFRSPPDSYDVVADADGVITSIGLEGKPVGDNPNIPRNNKYRIIIYHTCDFYSIYNLITSLSPRVVAAVGTIDAGSTKGTSIVVKKGELLGRIGGQTLDLSINYDKSILSGFVEPKSYERESWKIHTVDPFDYWAPDVKEKLMEKNIRTVPPYGGKIDYDIDGKLVGNWFVENTNGYRGVNPSAYWDTHLSFVYNEVIPSFVIVSLGNFAGEAKQFAVKGNAPNPADVGISMGLVKYELVDFYYTSNGKSWDRMTLEPNIAVSADEQVKGIVLAQLIEKRKLKVEVFAGKTASDIQRFTSNAKIYTR